MDEQFLPIQDLIYTNNQVNDELNQYHDELKEDNNILKKKLTKHDSYLDKIKTLLKQMMVQNQNSSPDKMEWPKAQDPTTVVPDNKKYTQL